MNDRRRQIAPSYFRSRKRSTTQIVLLIVESNRDTWSKSSATPRALIGRRLWNGLDRQSLHFALGGKSRNTCGSCVDHVTNTRDGQRTFGDIRCENDADFGMPLEDTLLFRFGEPCIEWQHLYFLQSSTLCQMPAKLLGSVPNFALGREERQNITATFAEQFIDGIAEAIHLAIVIGPRKIVSVRNTSILSTTITDLDGIAPPLDRDHGRRPDGINEVFGKSFCIDRSAGDDHSQIWTFRQQPL